MKCLMNVCLFFIIFYSASAFVVKRTAARPGGDDWNRISDGDPTKIGEFPYMVMLTNPNGYMFCGATLLSPLYVVTAGHCLHGKEAKDIIARFAEYDWTTPNETNSVDIPVAKVITNPKFNYQTTFFDIGLVRLERPVEFRADISPICLPALRDYSGEKAILSGWGSKTADTFPVPKLEKLTMPILSPEECRNRLKGLSIYLSTEKICAYVPNRDQCKGDSGGPLAWVDPATSKSHLVGVVSIGFDCGNKGLPSLFTSVPSHLAWIKEETKDSPPTCSN